MQSEQESKWIVWINNVPTECTNKEQAEVFAKLHNTEIAKKLGYKISIEEVKNENL